MNRGNTAVAKETESTNPGALVDPAEELRLSRMRALRNWVMIHNAPTDTARTDLFNLAPLSLSKLQQATERLPLGQQRFLPRLNLGPIGATEAAGTPDYAVTTPTGESWLVNVKPGHSISIGVDYYSPFDPHQESMLLLGLSSAAYLWFAQPLFAQPLLALGVNVSIDERFLATSEKQPLRSFVYSLSQEIAREVLAERLPLVVGAAFEVSEYESEAHNTVLVDCMHLSVKAQPREAGKILTTVSRKESDLARRMPERLRDLLDRYFRLRVTTVLG